MTSKTYTVEVKATAGNVTPTSGSNSFDLIVKNPCVDINFVKINGPTTLPPLSYIIASNPTQFDAHSAYTIST